MKYRSFTHFLRSLTAFTLALMLPFNALAGTLTLPAAIKVVEEQAFMDNTSVDKVVLPEGATTIKSQAFKGATSLERVVIPSTVEDIADDAFEGVESNIIIETSKGSPAWDWAEAKGIRVEDPNAPASDVTVDQIFSKLYLGGNRDEVVVARVYVEEGTASDWTAEYVSGNEGVRLYFANTTTINGKETGLLYADSITASGEAVWKITVTTESGSHSEEIQVNVVDADELPTELLPKEDDIFYGKIGEQFTFVPSEHFTADKPSDEELFGYSVNGEVWDEESFEYLDEGFSFMPVRNGICTLTVRYYQGNHMLTYDATIVIGELANVSMRQYCTTLYVNGNLEEMDVADFVCEDEAITGWNAEYVSGNEDISLYFDHTEDGKRGWLIAKDIVSAGESVWKVTLTTESGATWTDEVTINVRDDVELPTELLPIDGGDGILYGNVGEQFVFTGSELFQADVPMAEAIYGYSIYYEIYYHETYATHQDGIAGNGFSFTPDKNGRYGVWVRYFAGNHMLEYEAVIIIGDGSSTEAVMVTENLSPVIYLTDMSEDSHVWLGNIWLDRFPLLPGEEVEWTVELVESSSEEPVIGLDVSGVFPDTYGTNVTATGFSGETGTATYRITAKLGNTVISHDYEIEVKAAPSNLPTALNVPSAYYEVELGDELTFMLEDVTFADGEVPESMKVYTDFWGTERIDEAQEVTWLEDGISYRFVKEGRYTIDAVKIVGGVTIMQTITIVVGDGISDDVEFNWFTKMPVAYVGLEDDMINDHVGWFSVDNYDLFEDEGVEWTLEQIEGDELLKLRLEQNDGELNYWLYVDEILGGTGMTKYRVTVTTEGGLNFSAEFSIDVQNAPEGLPTEIIVDETDFYFEIGDTHEFLFDELELGEGYVPEGIQLRKEIWNVDQIPGAEYIESEDPEGAGVRVTFEENGRYAITFAIKIGNYMVTLPGTITVGSGMDEDAELVFDHFNEHHFPPAEDWMVNWAGDVYLENYELMPDETLEWSMQRLDESSLTPAEFMFDPFWDENRGVGLRLTNFTGEAGDMTYRITLTSSLGQSWSEDVTFHIYEQPENMPTAIAMPVMVFEIEKGETIYINRDDIHFVDGVVPEDAVVFKDIWINDVEDHSDFEWTREGFKATFHENGRFSFFTAVYLNGVEYVCQVKVLVGTGVSDDAGLHLSWLNPVQYPQDEQAWLGDLWLENYNVYGDEAIAWDAECIEGDESIVRVDLDVIEVDGQPFLAGLRLNDFSGETGTVTWRVTVSTNYGNSWSEDITFEVVEKPENLPTTLNGFETRIELNVGDTLRLYVDDIEFADGVVPEDAVIFKEYHTHNIDFLPGFEHMDDGFKVTFRGDGRYEVYAVAYLNGMEYVVPIQVIVGTGISSEARIRFQQNAYTAYATEDRDHNAWIGCVALEEYQIFEGEEIEWTIERIDENENTPLKAYVDNVWHDQYGANIHVTDFSGETGSMEYRIHMKSSSGYSTSVDFTLDVVEQPDNLPTILHVPSDNVQLNVGDTYELYEHDFTFGDGELPEGAALHYEFGDIEGTFHDQPFWWHENDDGFGVHFVREGRYEFTAYVLINTYRVSRTVRITVGDGMADNVHIGWFQPLEVAYTGIEGEVFALQAEVVDYQLFEGESYNWKIDYIGEGEEPLTVYINRDYDDGRGVILHAKDVQHTGLAAYRLSVTSEGGLDQAIEFTIDVQECPEDLPTQLGADCTDFRLDVGDTFTFRDTDVYFADGTVPENVMLVTEYWCFEQIENMESFQSLQTHGGFQVTFEDEGVYAFEVAKKIGNHVLTLPVRVIVGNGMKDFLFVDWKINPVFNDFGEDQNTFVTALQTKYFTSENELLQRENIEFTIDILNDDGNLPAELYLNDYHEPTWIDVHARNFTGGTGTIEYRVNAKLENGEVYSYESSVDIVDFPDNLPTEVIVEQEEYHLNPGDTFEYDLSTVSCAGGEIPEGAMHYAEAWTDGLERMHSFRWTDEGFRVTFYENDRFSFRVAYRINSYTIEKQIRIYVGNGHRDDTYVDWQQEIYTIYKDVEDESTWIGWGVLDNFNSFGDESATWTLGRIDESENDPVELFIEVFGGKHADLRFRNVESTGSVTYRLSVETDSGYLDSHDFTLNVEELPDNLPTELDMQTYYEYQVGDMFEFDSTQIGFANGVVPENASLRTHLRGIEELQNMESFEWTDTGFRVAFDYEGTFVFTVGRQIGNYTLTQDVRVKVGKGWNDDAHVDWGMTERTIYTNVDDWIWAFGAHLNNYPQCDGDELHWGLEWIDGVDFIDIERDWEYNEWNGVFYNFASTHDRTGTAVYRLSLHTDDGFEASQEYTVTVVERPDDLPTEINVGETEYHLNIGDTFTFTDEMVSFANGTVPEGAWTNVNFGYLEWGIDSIESFHWLDDVNGFEVTFDQNGRYMFSAMAWINNYLVTKHIHIYVGNGEDEDAYLNWFTKMPVAYIGLEEGMASDHIGWFVLENYHLFEDEQIHWNVEQIEGEHLLDLRLEEFDGAYNHWLYVDGFRGGTGMTKYRVTVTTDGGFESSAEFSIDVQNAPENLPVELVVDTVDWEFNVGDTHEFLFTDIGYGEGDVPEGALIRREIWGLEEQISGAELICESDDPEGDGYSVTFDSVGSYDITYVIKINNYMLMMPGSITVTAPVSEETHVDWGMTERTIYTNVDEWIWAFGAHLNGYPQCDGDELHWDLEWVDGVDFIDIERDWEYNEWNGVFYNFASTHDRTGTAVYRLNLHTNGGFSASQDYTVTVMERPDDLPTDINVGETEYHLNIGDTFTFTDEMVSFADGNVPEDAWTNVNFGYLEWGIDSVESFHWLDDAHGFEVTFDQNGRYMFSAMAWINNYLLTKHIYINVGTGVPDGVNVEYWGTERTIYSNSHEQAWGFYAELHDYSLLPEERLEWTLEQVSEGEPVAFVERNFDAGHRELGCRYDVLPTGEATGTVVYRLTLTTDSGFTSSKDITIHVEDRPDDLPTELNVGPTEYNLRVGETFTFTADMISFANGNVPEGAYTEINFGYLEHGINEQESFRWLEHTHGFEVSFQDKGRYMFSAMSWVNNHLVTKHIFLNVETNANEEAELVWFTKMPVAYVGLEEGHISDHVGWFYVDRYELPEGERVHWEVEQIEGEELLYLRLEEFDDPLSYWLYVDGVSGGTGMTKYRVTVTTEGGLERSAEFSIDVQNAPEGLPTEVIVEQTDWHFEIGDYYEFRFDSVGYGDGYVPEDALVRGEIWNVENIPGAEQIFESDDPEGDGYRVTFDRSGRYDITYAIKINNYMITLPGTITVGSGENSENGLVFGALNRQHYPPVDEHRVNWAGDIYLENYELEEGETLEWHVERIDENENTPAEFFLDPFWDENRGAGMRLRNFTGEAGSMTYRITLESNMERSWSEEITFVIHEQPENLPTGITLPENIIHINEHETLFFNRDEIEFVDGEVLDGAYVYKEFWIGELEERTDFRWTDEGFAATFHESGRYAFDIAAYLNGVEYNETIWVVVGSGVREEAHIQFHQHAYTAYATEDEHNAWIGCVALYEYEILPDEEIEWSIERVDGRYYNPLNAYVDNVWEDQYGANIHVTDFTGESGLMKYRLHMNSSYGFHTSCDFKLDVVDLPENMPTALEGPADEVHVEVGDVYDLYPEDFTFADGVVPENANFHYEFDNVEWTFRDQDFWWHENDGCFSVKFGQEGRYEFTASVLINTYRLSRTIRIIVGDGVRDDVYLNLWHSQDPVYTGLEWGGRSWVGNAYVENYQLFTDETIEWSVVKKNADEETVAVIELSDTWDNGLGQNYEVADITATGETSYVISAVLPTGETLTNELTQHVTELPEGLPTELVVPQDSYVLHVGEEFTLMLSDIQFGEGNLPENAAYHTDIFPDEELSNLGIWNWFETEDGADGGVSLVFDEPGFCNLYAQKWIGNYMLDQTITLYVVDSESDWKIAMLVGSEYQGGEEYTAARKVQNTYGEDRVIVETYPDNFAEEYETMQNQVLSFAEDPDVKAIIISQGVAGTADLFMMVNEMRPDMLLMTTTPQDEFDYITGMADVVMMTDEVQQAYPIMETCEAWNVDVFVHYSFDRHLGNEAVAGRRAILMQKAAELGIEFVDVTIPDPLSEGLDAACEFISMSVDEKSALYAGQKVAFFSTNCGVQGALQSAVLRNENAYYPSPCCPSPYHGFEESMGLTLDMNGNPNSALRKIASVLAEHNALGRFSTWAAPVNMGMVEAAGKYAVSFATSILQSANDSNMIERILRGKYGNITISNDEYDNLYTILLDPVDFHDYTEPTKIAILTGSEAQSSEEYIAAQKVKEAYGSDRVIVETYADNFMDDPEATTMQILDLAMDRDVSAVIVAQGIPGTAEGFEMARDNREDILLMTVTPHEEFDTITARADVVMMADEVQQALTIMETCENWNVDVFVHYSFDRHLGMENVAARRALLMEKAEKLGIEFVDISFPDPATEGLDDARSFISNSVDEQCDQYEGKKVAFFSTNCGVQAALQSAVLRNGNAYYPSPCCPSPYHGFGESLNLELDLWGDPAEALAMIADALAENGARHRFSTGAVAVNMGMLEAAGDYAMAYANEELSNRNDEQTLLDLLGSKIGSVSLTNNDYDNLYSILLGSVNFGEYTEPTKIAFLTGSEAQGREEYLAAMNAMEIYGADRVIVEQYADNFAEDPQATAEQILELAMDHDVSAIIVAQSVPGTVEGFEMARENREDILLVSVVPMEDFGDMSNAADIMLYSDEPAQAETIMQKCEEWGIEVFVHYSFDRHLGLDAVAGRRAGLMERAEEMGIEFVDIDIPDPVSSAGLEGACAFIEENLPEVMAEYEGQRVAFFSTNCGVQATLQSAVLENELAYYPQPCCPSPYHGFGEALGVEDELDYGRPDDALRMVAEALYAQNAADRFSTWASPVNMGLIDVAAEYAMLYADYEITDRNDGELLEKLVGEHFSGATIQQDTHGNGYSLLLTPINFMDYVINHNNVIQLWVADSVIDFTAEQVEAFKAANDDFADVRVHIRGVGESEAADKMLENTETGADMYVFAQDQLARLVNAGALTELNESNAAIVAGQNAGESVAAVTLGDTLYAYPMTADNGYFLYFDHTLMRNPTNLDELLAVCEETERTFHMEITSGWYQPAFFFGAGCTLNYTTTVGGDFIGCEVDYASENGLRAFKSMLRMINSPAFRNDTDPQSIGNMGALVSGTWMGQAVQEVLGEGYSAVKLPEVDGYQMSSFSGYKMLGVKPQESEFKQAACEALAMYLTSEEVQAARYEEAGWGPSNSSVQEYDAVKHDVALNALLQQLPYSVVQGQYPDEYWDLAAEFGEQALNGEFNNLSDEELMEVLAAFEDAVSALASEPETYTLLRARASNSVFEGWGTSLCWWANRIGYSDTLSQQAADLFYSEDGLDFNIMRYNIGGGDDPTHRHITRTDSAVPGWMKWDEVQQQFVYDYEADHNQLNVLLRAVNAAGENAMVEAFSNSPPYFMTVSGCSSGGEDPSVDNLRDDCYEDFAEYLAHVTDYLQRELSVPVVSLSPMNEPNTSYWRYLSDKQEGCHFDAGASQSKILEATAEAMQRYELTNVLLAASDETSPEKQLEAWYAYSDQARNAIGRINTHTYGEEQIETLGQLVKDENLHLWMSEVDGGETAGENAGEMGAALWLGQKIISDLNALSPSAWVMWQAIDNHISQDGYNGNQDYGMVDVNQGYWGIAVADHDNKEIILTQKYYGMGQFTRYIRPGSTLIHCGPELIAAYDGHSGQLSIVTVNVSKQVKDICLDVSEFVQDTSVRVIRTSGGTEDGEQWAELVPAAVEDGLLNVSLKEHSITTFVLSI